MILKNKFIEINKDVKFNEKNFGLKINTTWNKGLVEINEFCSAPLNEKVTTFEMSTLTAEHFGIPFDEFKRLNFNVDSLARMEHDEDGMEVTNNTLLNMVHIEELGDSMVKPTPLEQSIGQIKFPFKFDDYACP